MKFINRADAGRQLATKLMKYSNKPNTIVLGIPRGGVVVAYQIAKTLHLPLDIFLSHKLSVPGHEELAFGAVAAGDGLFLDATIIRAVKIAPEEIDRIAQETRLMLDRRALAYRGGRTELALQGQTVILVDDGIATGASIFAAVHALREASIAKLVVGVPVVPHSTCKWLEAEVDELALVSAPIDFYAVGQFYENFDQTPDSEVIELLSRNSAEVPVASASHPIVEISESDVMVKQLAIPMNGQSLLGTLSVPAHAHGIVLFAHGSGSSRHSPRNLEVSWAFQRRGLATLLFDLLTPQEEEVDRYTKQYRFDIPLLAERLALTTRWVRSRPEARDLPIAYFGASTGAAAALVAAARSPREALAVVSRGGRPDLAAGDLARVKAATLLIVGERDREVLDLNRRALPHLRAAERRLDVIPGATHLFEEPGAMEQVAQLAGTWFLQHIPANRGLQSV